MYIYIIYHFVSSTKRKMQELSTNHSKNAYIYAAGGSGVSFNRAPCCPTALYGISFTYNFAIVMLSHAT